MGSTKTGRRRMKVKVTRRIDVVTVIVHFINVRLALSVDSLTVGAAMLSGRVIVRRILSDFVLTRRKKKMGMTMTRTRLIGMRRNSSP